MKATCYLRIARSQRGFTFNATTKPSVMPLSSGNYALPTRQLRLTLDLPDDLFVLHDADVVVQVPERALEIVATVEDPAA